MEGQSKATWIAAGAAVVTAVITVLSTSIVSGALNATVDRILENYEGRSVQITDNYQRTRTIDKRKIEMGKRTRLRTRPISRRSDDAEEATLIEAFAENRSEELAGHFERVSEADWVFSSVRGNRYSIEVPETFYDLEGKLVVATATVRTMADGPSLTLKSARRLGNL